MDSFISTLLSVFGMGKNHSQATSQKRTEASQLNCEFELQLEKTADFLRSERIHLMHRLQAISDDTDEALKPINEAIENLLDQIQTGLNTAQNSRITIDGGSSLASLRKWDEVIGLLYQQKSGAELIDDKSQRCIAQFHRVIDNLDLELLDEGA